MGFFSRSLKALRVTKYSRSASSISHHLSVRPGQIPGSHFEVVKQLGAGQHSTVWLATSASGPKALKILTDDVTLLQGKDAFELEVLEKIAFSQLTSRNKRLLQLQDHFSRLWDLNVFSRHCDRCHTVHTDIKSDNILFNTATMLENVDVILSSVNLVDIVLVDFGTAMPHSAPHTRLIQPVAFRCPEVITSCVWNYKADIWNLGCIVFELMTGQHLFKPKAGASWSAEQCHLARIFSTFGARDVPQHLLDFFRQGQHSEKYFNDKGKWNHNTIR
ncbi:kinase-like protein [Ramaria rubella]|nr:kinase-like protein [Ramaria rubella]